LVTRNENGVSDINAPVLTLTGEEGNQRQFSIKDIIDEEASLVQNKVFVSEPVRLQQADVMPISTK